MRSLDAVARDPSAGKSDPSQCKQFASAFVPQACASPEGHQRNRCTRTHTQAEAVIGCGQCSDCRASCTGSAIPSCIARTECLTHGTPRAALMVIDNRRDLDGLGAEHGEAQACGGRHRARVRRASPAEHCRAAVGEGGGP